jgi:hypothetical protein
LNIFIQGLHTTPKEIYDDTRLDSLLVRSGRGA